MAASPPEGTGPPRGEILVVDDEPAVVELLLNCLAVAGYRGTGASTAAEALELLRWRPFDVMLCDLLMPQMSGLELMVKARLDAPDMAMVVVTAVSDIDTAIRSMRLGAYDYLVKPISPGDVVLRVASAMEMRRHVLETRQAQQRLQTGYSRLQRMAEVKDNLVQMLVHDLKAPLSSAMGYMELIERKTGESFSERQLRYLQQAYASCKEVLRMTATMLDVSRLQQGVLRLHRAPLDLPALLRDAAAEIEPLFEATGVQIEIECRRAPPHVLADKEIVRRILSNLLANAAEHAPPGGRVSVAAGPGQRDFVVISVADNGKGILPEDHERIFEMFFQREPDARTGGAGIGLAFCKMAVEAQGGSMWVESPPGEGATFRFSLPVAGRDAVEESRLETGGKR